MALNEDDPLLKMAMGEFDRAGYSYHLKLNAAMMWVEGKDGTLYAFYPTTGRWNTYGMKKHYRSKSPADFLERFVKKNDREAGLID